MSGAYIYLEFWFQIPQDLIVNIEPNTYELQLVLGSDVTSIQQVLAMPTIESLR